MGMISRTLARKVSEALGTEVTFEKLNVSLLGGSLEAMGVTVSGDRPGEPLLKIRRVFAELAVGRALNREIAIKSLSVEAPQISIVQRAGGATNLPKGRRSGPGEVRAEKDDDDSESQKWKFEAQKILLVDGEVRFVRENGFEASATKVLANATQKGDTYEFTLVSDAVTIGSTAAPGKVELTGVIEIGPDVGVRVRELNVHAMEIAIRL